MILDGKKCAESLYDSLRESVKSSHGLAIITVGNDAASKVYVRNKIDACRAINLRCDNYTFDSSIDTATLAGITHRICESGNYTGVIVQLPLPAHINFNTVLAAIPQSLDVDGFRRDTLYHSATPLGIIRLLNYYNIPLKERNAVIIGRGKTTALPLEAILRDELNCTVSLVHSHSDAHYRSILLSNADLIISAVGKPNMVIPDDIPSNKPVLVNVGIHFENGRQCGDIPDTCIPLSSAFVPARGGVGPMTVAQLIANTVLGPHTIIKE